MGRAKIGDLAVGELDPAGQPVREIYARNDPMYGVYRTAKRVCVQFADDADREGAQRKAMVPLAALRGDINGLIDGWRTSDRYRAKARRRRFDRGTADALISALEEDPAGALHQLTAVRATIVDGRTAIGRFQYLGMALAIVVLVFLSLWLTSLRAISSSPVTTVYTHDVLIAIGGGALGAFLSIAMGLKSRTVLPDLQWVANLCDAVLRMVVGIVAGAIFLCLLRGGFGLSFASLSAACRVGQDGCDPHQGWMQIFALGFVAGFFERLVSDLLDKAGASARTSAVAAEKPVVPPVASPVMPPATPPAMLRSAEADQSGDCLCDHPLAAEDATPDWALPAATGGVAGERS